MTTQNEIVHVHHNKPFTDSLVIADGVGLKHKRVNGNCQGNCRPNEKC